jgi:signal transduction histidine kinase
MATQVEELATPLSGNPDTDALLRHLPMGALIVEAPSGRFLCVNPQALALWGGDVPVPGSLDEYTRRFTGVRPDGRAYAREEWPVARAMHGDVVEEEEIELAVPDGSRRTIMMSAAPVRGEAGEVVRVVALFRDVTEDRCHQRRREFLISLSEELRLLDEPGAIAEAAVVATGEYLGVTSVSFADVDEAGRFAQVRAEYRNGRVAPTGRYYLEEFGPALAERVRQGAIVAVEDIATDPVAGAEVFEDWSIRSLLCVPIVEQGRVAAIVTLMHSAPRHWSRDDVVLVRQAAEWSWRSAGAAQARADLRQSREWLALALRAGSAATWEWNLRSGEIQWSGEHDALLGVEGERRNLTFNRWLALVHSEDRAEARRAARRIAAMGEGEIELEHRLAGDVPRWLTMRGRVLADGRGPARRVVGIAMDSTSRRVEAMRLQDALAQAREASEAKSSFIGVISHEFRTPLAAIIGYADLLASGISGPLVPTQERQLDRIRASAWHLTQLVDEILTFSRIEAGSEILRPECTDAASVAREARALMAPAAAAKGLGLVGELPDGQVMLETDPGKLRQVLLNLLGNAVKFTEKGGVTLRLVPCEDRLVFEVVDTGTGIQPADQQRIFERFWQGGREGNRTVSGAGLGLTVCRHLVHLLGGDIAVDSEPGAGSTFRFHIPRKLPVTGSR